MLHTAARGANGGGGAQSRTRPPRRPLIAIATLIVASTAILIYALTSSTSLPTRLNVRQQCRMSRMWPAYIDYTDSLQPFSPSLLYKKYRLYLYRERTLEPNDSPTGSPALFVPGNAGSYAQVRSVASSAAHQWWQPGTGGMRQPEWQNLGSRSAHTDWWTVDFNEDFSAFSGSTLIQQATFLNEVIAFLRDRYPSPAKGLHAAGDRNVSIPILAHSMGGISARLMTTLDNHTPHSIDTIVTLSTPHAFPPAPVDKSVEHVYRTINRKGDSAGDANDDQALIVSIAGGLLDSQLPSDPASLPLASLNQRWPDATRLSTFTSSLASLWSSVDHLAVMWCDQVREKIARGFLLDAAHFGRIAEERNAGGLEGATSVARKRRELWRRVLGVAQQDDGGALFEAGAADPSDWTEVHVDPNDSPTLQVETSGDHSVLRTGNASDSVYHRPLSAAADGGEEALAFEMVTNLCIGANPAAGTGSPIAQPIELFVLMCRRSREPSNPNKEGKAICEPVLPWRWQLMPPSGLPDAHGRDTATLGTNDAAAFPAEFPDAHRLYHIPGQALQRLRIDSRTIRDKGIDFVRLERMADDGSVLKQHGRRSFTRAGWVRELDGRVSRSGSLIGPGSVDLDLSPRLGSTSAAQAAAASPALVIEWAVHGIGSSLLAWHVELIPAKCFLKNVARNAATYTTQPTGSFHPSVPAFAPLLRISDPLTGDSRWYPSLIPPALVDSIKDARHTKHGDRYPLRFPLSLHGAAPFLPPPRSNDVHVQLWSDPTLLQSPPGARPEDVCAAPFDSFRLTVNWRSSIGLMVLRYRFFVLAWPLALLACIAAKMWYDWTVVAAAGNDVAAFPSLLDYLTQRWTVKLLLPSLVAALVCGDAFQRLCYTALGIGRDDVTSWTVGAIVGMPQPSGLFVPLLLAAMVSISYTVLLLLALGLHHSIGLGVKVLSRLGLARRISWGRSGTQNGGGPPRFRPASLVGLGSLLLAIVLVVPYQFVFLVLCLMHIGNTVRSRIDVVFSSSSTASPLAAANTTLRLPTRRKSSDGGDHDADDDDAEEVEGYDVPTHLSPCSPSNDTTTALGLYNQHLLLLLFHLLLLPQKAPVLIVWIRNLLSVGLLSPHTPARWIDHNPIDVLPFLLLTKN